MIVIIAHRLSTVRNCDYIYVLKDGRIVEEGSFDELYRDTDSLFYNMCLIQNLWRTMKNEEIIIMFEKEESPKVEFKSDEISNSF